MFIILGIIDFLFLSENFYVINESKIKRRLESHKGVRSTLFAQITCDNIIGQYVLLETIIFRFDKHEICFTFKEIYQILEILLYYFCISREKTTIKISAPHSCYVGIK